MNGDDVILRYSEGSLESQRVRSFGVPQSQDENEGKHHPPARLGRRWLTNAAIVLYFALLTAALFGDLLTSSRSVVSAVEMDVDQQFFAWRSFAFGELRQGRLPLWNPYSFGGLPALGNFQYALLYPPNWLHLILSTGRAINVVAALHIFLAGVLAAAWCRERRSSAIAAALGGTMFALGGPYILHLYAGHLTYLCVVAWTPLIFLAADRIVAGSATRFAWLLGAFAIAMQVLGGYPQPAYYTGITLIVYVIARLLRAPARVWVRVFAAIGAMYVLGALLAAPQLLPALDAARESVRAQPLPYSTAASYSLPVVNLLTLVAPYPFGDDFSVPYAGEWVMWETSLYIGPAALVLAALGAMRSKRRSDRAALVVAILGIVLALGANMPVFKVLYHALPGIDRFRVPARFGAIAVLMLAVLAAHGFDLMRRRRRRGTSRLAVAALVGAGWVAALALLLIARPQAWGLVLEDTLLLARSAAHGSRQLLRTAGVLAQVGVVLLLARRVPWLAYAMAVLVVADVAISAARAVERFQPYQPAYASYAPGHAPPAPRWPDQRSLIPLGTRSNDATQFGYEHAWGYDPAMPARWADLVGPLLGADARAGDFRAAHVEPSPLWAMLRVNEFVPAGVKLHAPPLPRALLVDEATVVDGPAASLAAVREPHFDPRARVVLETRPSPAPVPGSTPPGTVEVTRSEPGEIEIGAQLHRPAILLITDAYSAGWVASPVTPLGQQRYDVLPANHALRAIPLRAGKHRILLAYAPLSVTIGMLVSTLAWIGFAGAVVVLVIRGRLAAHDAGP